MAGSKQVAIRKPDKGRPSLYRPQYAEQARKLCLLGFTDEELANFFGVCIATIYNWQRDHIDFLEAIRAGKVVADAEVADSLYRRATGEHITAEKVVKNGECFEAIRFRQYIPGDPNAAYRWLLNRRRENWTDSAKLDVAGSITVNIVKPPVLLP